MGLYIWYNYCPSQNASHLFSVPCSWCKRITLGPQGQTAKRARGIKCCSFRIAKQTQANWVKNVGSLHLCLFPIPTLSLLSAKHLTELDQYSMHCFFIFSNCWYALGTLVCSIPNSICIPGPLYNIICASKPLIPFYKRAREEPCGLRQADGQTSTPKHREEQRIKSTNSQGAELCLILI